MTTDQEKQIAMKLAEAWSLFLSLEKRSNDEVRQFIDGIHRCQDVMMCRVARRADPDFWSVEG